MAFPPRSRRVDLRDSSASKLVNRVLADFAVAPHTPMHRVNLIPSFPIGWDQFLSEFHACTVVASNEQNMHQNPELYLRVSETRHTRMRGCRRISYAEDGQMPQSVRFHRYMLAAPNSPDSTKPTPSAGFRSCCPEYSCLRSTLAYRLDTSTQSGVYHFIGLSCNFDQSTRGTQKSPPWLPNTFIVRPQTHIHVGLTPAPICTLSESSHQQKRQQNSDNPTERN